MAVVDVDSTYERFCDRTLSFEEWTHEAHLAVCWRDLRTRTPDASLDFLRGAIRAYNDTVGTVNSDSSGYHETLTAFFVGAIAGLAAGSFAEVIRSPLVDRGAPLRHWSRERLFGVEARRRWVAPDLAPLTFEPPRPSTGGQGDHALR